MKGSSPNMIFHGFLSSLRKWHLFVVAAAMLLGFTGLFLAVQIHFDFKELERGQTPAFDQPNLLTVQKALQEGSLPGVFEPVVFTPEEMRHIVEHPTVLDAVPYTSNAFAATAVVSLGFTVLQSEVFFESVADRFVDAASDDWSWQAGDDEVPLLAPLDFLHLYNFGFAASQGYPALSRESASAIPLMLILRANGGEVRVRARVVGFSERLETLLVPTPFMEWANEQLGVKPPPPRRLLLETTDNRDPRLQTFLRETHLQANLSRVGGGPARSLMDFLLKILTGAAVGIIFLAVALLLLSMELALVRSEKFTARLLEMGYAPGFLLVPYGLAGAMPVLLASIGGCGLAILGRGQLLQMLESLGYALPGDFPQALLLAALCAPLVPMAVLAGHLWFSLSKAAAPVPVPISFRFPHQTDKHP
jgi:hypothetical protein